MTAQHTNFTASVTNISEGQPAPSFTTQDVHGNVVNLSDFKGKKLLLFFSRSVGCPICNLRFHTLQSHAAWFKQNNFQIVMISESSAEVMKQYLEGVEVFPVMIPNSDQDLYRLYNVERSFGKVVKGVFNGMITKARKGIALYEKKVPMDGNKDRMEAEFLINENGIIVKAHYAGFLGDEISLQEIKAFVKS